jgi:hypothetical protein
MAGRTWSFHSWRLFLESFSEIGSPSGEERIAAGVLEEDAI